MAYSLLAHLYSHIRGSQEDIATYSLQYILTNTEQLNKCFCNLICDRLFIDRVELQYICQSAGKNLERPDMAGVAANGKEKILIEAKFYAALTENQPNAYLDRLIKEEGQGLLFICPNQRKSALWAKLKELCAHRSIRTLSDVCVAVDGISMGIITWNQVLETLRLTASNLGADCISDIDQLIGYCREMDDAAFIPFSSDELGPDNAKAIERYYQVIDETSETILADKRLESNMKGLRATPYRKGYVRYLHVDEFCLGVKYDRYLWANSQAETPFWYYISKEWKQNEDIIDYYNSLPAKEKATDEYGTIHIALYAPPGATEEEIANQMTNQIVSSIFTLKQSIGFGMQ